ncbi:hypothetical protein BBO99_00009295 [Phytophthora kernoviae]|uniref:G-protein coupled receptors family 3 profile domain-containing protein n=2 Tax=Phytophthora kernoviae TaxID=325452 RepID=A0A3R7GZD7_9STRA|nr:hypothetical protein G195_010964 [Phytophthora kernoviae 00238/432]KAG2506131.1 hypothetical protein JM16_009037 [Phytophthora kernoviae]KAG2508217.1 hypothetical protein JM18_009227 [Phytophthora kernoviae]RLM96139.1 hypothetical protein BBI17_009340 [Phytophthora kernoviae]RLN73669.1 hypothetical protein BBO99_00009295 [Phytophthora kernoviae]
MGFTTIFGSLVIKSLRVYRVFMSIIFVAWFAVDFPEPTVTSKEATEFRGTVDRISCSSSSFIFTALLIFWKAILLMLGLYLSFLIRNVSVDFQESPWIFGSVIVVLVDCFVMMPMSYLVDMPAATYYVFLAVILLLCTVLIMALMLGPKVFRLKELASTTSAATAGTSGKSRTSLVPTKSNASNMSETDVDAVGKSSQKYQVKPIGNGMNSTPTMEE